jgi:hypothetical protein
MRVKKPMSRGRLSLSVVMSLMSTVLLMVKVAPLQALPIPGTTEPARTPASSSHPAWWQPGRVTSWQYDLGWPVAVPTNLGAVQVYDIDYDGSEQGTEAQVAAVVARIHASEAHAICYVEIGGWENYRPDANRYPHTILGHPISGYPDERYVDIRRWAVIGPILNARFRQCKSEGFDGVETDIDDSYTDATGFPLTLHDEVTFDSEVARAIHALGLAWFLKNGINDDAFISDMEPLADGTVNEQCWQYNECPQVEPFAKAGKPILNVEYANLPSVSTCRQALAFPMATMHTDVNLDGKIAWACWRGR